MRKNECWNPFSVDHFRTSALENHKCNTGKSKKKELAAHDQQGFVKGVGSEW
jgi:hypothetical protein